MQTAFGEKAKQLVVPPKAGEAAPALHFDGSIWVLVASNVLALAVAHWQRWPLTQLMLVYWAQSVAIGISYLLRILALEKFSTENFRINDREVEPTPGTQRQVAVFFAFHYGFFHAMYLLFLAAGPSTNARPQLDAWFWLCVLAFALNHFWSYRYNREVDRQGTPNIGTLMFTPYLRIIPMHLTIIGGGLIGKGGGLLLFGGLKVLADVAMHLIEHRRLRAGPAKSE